RAAPTIWSGAARRRLWRPPDQRRCVRWSFSITFCDLMSGSEEALRVLSVADQEDLGLLVVLEHHQVGLAADAGLLVAAEGRVSRVVVVGVGPHTTGLDLTTGAVGGRAVAAPHAGAEAVEGVVGDVHRVGEVLEGGDRE